MATSFRRRCILDPLFDFSELITKLEANEINYCRLYAKHYKQAKVCDYLSGFRQLIKYKSDPYGTQGYLISKTGIVHFLNSVKEIARPVDDELGRFWCNNLIPYSVFPHPLIERAVASSIEAEREANRKANTLGYFTNRIKDKISKSLYLYKYY